MSRTSHGHELVRSYLRELDAALRGVPAAQARELKEQIIAHLDDALPPDADDEQVTAVLGRLGTPAGLAADAGQPGLAPRAALGLTRTWLRRRLAHVRRRTWTVLAVVVVLAGVATGYLTTYVASAPLQLGDFSSWWYRQDYMHALDTYADGATQTSVPIRPGQRQGFLVNVYNPAGVTETVLGPGNGVDDPTDSLGLQLGQIGVSAPNWNIDRGASGGARSVSYTLPGVIPPHQYRMLRVLWISNACMGGGGTESIDQLSLRVRIGWFTRTEIIPLGQAWGISAPSRTRCP